MVWREDKEGERLVLYKDYWVHEQHLDWLLAEEDTNYGYT